MLIVATALLWDLRSAPVESRPFATRAIEQRLLLFGETHRLYLRLPRRPGFDELRPGGMARPRGINDPLGCRVVVGLSGGIQRRATAPRQDEDVLVCAHSRCDGPLDLVGAVGIDVFVHDDDALQRWVGAKRSQGSIARLSRPRLDQAHHSMQPITAAAREHHARQAGHSIGHGPVHTWFLRTAHEQTVLAATRNDGVIDEARTTVERRDFEDGLLAHAVERSGEIHEGPFVCRLTREPPPHDDLGVSGHQQPVEVYHLELTEQGEVYLPGSPDYIIIAKRRKLLVEGSERIVAYLVPAVITPAGNPAGIRSLEDLAGPGTRVGLGNPETVCLGLYRGGVLAGAASIGDDRRQPGPERGYTGALRAARQ